VGVTPNGSGWKAKIHVNKKCVYLGTYKTQEEASAAYVVAKKELHTTWSIKH
jgi:hypothetical protein